MLQRFQIPSIFFDDPVLCSTSADNQFDTSCQYLLFRIKCSHFSLYGTIPVTVWTRPHVLPQKHYVKFYQELCFNFQGFVTHFYVRIFKKRGPPLPIPQQNLNNLRSASNTERISVAAETAYFCSESTNTGRFHITKREDCHTSWNVQE